MAKQASSRNLSLRAACEELVRGLQVGDDKGWAQVMEAVTQRASAENFGRRPNSHVMFNPTSIAHSVLRRVWGAMNDRSDENEDIDPEGLANWISKTVMRVCIDRHRKLVGQEGVRRTASSHHGARDHRGNVYFPGIDAVLRTTSLPSRTRKRTSPSSITSPAERRADTADPWRDAVREALASGGPALEEFRLLLLKAMTRLHEHSPELFHILRERVCCSTSRSRLVKEGGLTIKQIRNKELAALRFVEQAMRSELTLSPPTAPGTRGEHPTDSRRVIRVKSDRTRIIARGKKSSS